MPDPKTRILNRLAEIKLEIDSTTQDRATVILDQQSIGRLSRMDAMQQQAMANATHQRRKNEQIRLSAALVRLETGEYGYCQECGEAIDPKRLILNPAVATCITCARLVDR